MKTLIIIIVITIVGLVAFAMASSWVSDIVDGTSVTSTVDANSITVTISGQVNTPGTYVLSQGATLIDLIDAGGGVTGNADPLAFDTGYSIESKGSYYIAPLYDTSDACSLTAITKCNVNSADATTLQDVAGFSKSAANALVSYRISNTFGCLEEITNVSGIGSATYTTVRDRITLRDGATTSSSSSSSEEEEEDEDSSSSSSSSEDED